MALRLMYWCAREDQGLCSEIEKHLSALKRHFNLEVWGPGQIEPGGSIDYQLISALKRSEIIMIPISCYFLSDERYNLIINVCHEIARIYPHRKIIPLLLRPVIYDHNDNFLCKLKALPDDNRPVTSWPDAHEAMSNITSGLRKTIENYNLLAEEFAQLLLDDNADAVVAFIRKNGLRIAGNLLGSGRSSIGFTHRIVDYQLPSECKPELIVQADERTGSGPTRILFFYLGDPGFDVISDRHPNNHVLNILHKIEQCWSFINKQNVTLMTMIVFDFYILLGRRDSSRERLRKQFHSNLPPIQAQYEIRSYDWILDSLSTAKLPHGPAPIQP